MTTNDSLYIYVSNKFTEVISDHLESRKSTGNKINHSMLVPFCGVSETLLHLISRSSQKNQDLLEKINLPSQKKYCKQSSTKKSCIRTLLNRALLE